ncbi:hypothetical protein GCM10010371_57450 [Streptomyces subrutilus]|uniref:TrbL/VirB6 plasmid conjugal transfer protein n=1 Tax=Streptomyces subrutilus TaxID=36818 RepID=A0A918VDQ9_9ACTN|nr:hypothetical protein [Streptomyces subrutilus]GGZ90029.1 hypothetical protein GCM10010371_57450 [Streptomyces subrutilus]
MKRIAAILLAAVAVLALVLVPQAAADDPKPKKDGAVSQGVEVGCQAVTGSSSLGAAARLIGTVVAGRDACDAVGDKVEEKAEEYWQSVWDSVIGDVIRSAVDVVKWLLRSVFTLALLGPSLKLEDTGLFEEDAKFSGMLVWLGWVIAAFGTMWSIGKAALSGKAQDWGRVLIGYAQNALLSGVGLTVVVLLLKLSDALTTGLVNATFEDKTFDRLIEVMVPAAVLNPVLMIGIVQVLLLVGIVQLVLIFLRESAIPIQCLLLPIAGAGLMGGESTRGWTPKLVTSICTVIAYKPIVAMIICTGFAEVGRSHTLVEWLRGVATLCLAVIAPGPLTKLFAPLGAEIGAGLNGSGALGAAANMAGSYLNKGGGDDPDPSGGGGGAGGGTDAVSQSQYVEKSMGPQKQGDPGEAGQDALAQSSRTAQVPAQGGPEGAVGGVGGTEAAAGLAATSTAAAATGGATLALQVLDGVNDAVHGAASTMGDGDRTG